MITQCYSSNGKCPCFKCDKNCCINSTNGDMTNTEKLCDAAKEYCEACALKHKEQIQALRKTEPIIIKKDEVLILKAEMLLHPRELEKVRNDVVRQIEGGAVIIPNGFTYTICKRDCLEKEGE